MSVAVSRTRVKEKCALTGTAHDAAVDALIAEMLIPIDHALRPDVAAGADAGTQATINLAATEIVAGEYLAQLGRALGWFDTIQVGDLRLAPSTSFDPLDPFGLKSQGWARVRPYLRVDPAMPAQAVVRTAGAKQGGER